MLAYLLLGALTLLLISMAVTVVQRSKHYKLKLISPLVYRVEMVLIVLNILFTVGIGAVVVPYTLHHPNYLHEQSK